jgi:hypothetical protein
MYGPNSKLGQTATEFLLPQKIKNTLVVTLIWTKWNVLKYIKQRDGKFTNYKLKKKLSNIIPCHW